jgi:S1-C subfamily serine protease
VQPPTFDHQPPEPPAPGYAAWPPPPPPSDDVPIGAPPRFGGPPGWVPQPPPQLPPESRQPRGVVFTLLLLVVAAMAVLALVAAAGGSLLRNGTRQSGPLPVVGGDQASSDLAGKVTPAVVDILSTFPEGLAAGSGMVITSSGEVLTNNHVVDGATSVQVQVGGVGRTYDVRVVGTDPTADVALLQIQGASDLPTVSTGDSAKVSVGDAVVAIGNALGRQGPPTAAPGHVTGLDRTITASDGNGQSFETLTGLIEVDANVVPGDSGGPLVDQSGKVIGMDTAASARRFRFRTGSSQGFAIPIATALSVAQRLRAGGSAPSSTPAGPTALLGVQLRDAGDQGPGALVVGVQSGSPADAAGLGAGDVIVSLDGRDVQSAAQLRAAIRAHAPGDRVLLGWVDTAGDERSATVRLASTG